MVRVMRCAWLVMAALPLAGCQTGGAGPFDSVFAASPAPGASADPLVMGKAGSDLGKAQAYFRDRNFGLAEERFRAAVETDPKNADAWLGLGATYDELRRFDLADRAYGHVERLTGPSAALLNNRGYSRYLRGDLAAARRDLTAAQAKAPNNPAIARNIALLSAR